MWHHHFISISLDTVAQTTAVFAAILYREIIHRVIKDWSVVDHKKSSLAMKRRKNTPQKNTPQHSPGCKLDYQATYTQTIFHNWLHHLYWRPAQSGSSQVSQTSLPQVPSLSLEHLLTGGEIPKLQWRCQGGDLYHAKHSLAMADCCQDRTHWQAFSNVPASKMSNFQSTRSQAKPRLK